MVHVPFFNFDIPEPRLAELLPKAAAAALRGATKVCDAARDALFPLTDAQREAHEQALIAGLPRELRRAHKRILLQQNERDALAVSSELEDASYAYYRRRMRTAVVGRSDEDTDDAAWRRLVAGGDAVREAMGAAERAERALVVASASAAMSPEGDEEEQAAAAAAAAEAASAPMPSRPWQWPRGAADGEGEGANGSKQQRRAQRRQQKQQEQPMSLAGGLGSGAAGLAVGAAAVELARALAGAMRERSRRRAREERRRKAREAREAEEEARAAAEAAGGATPARRRRRPAGVPRAPRPTGGGA